MSLNRSGLAVAVASAIVAAGCAGENPDVTESEQSSTSTSIVATSPTTSVDDPPLVLPDSSVVDLATSGVIEQARTELRSVLLGVSADRATAALEAAGWEVRVVSEDGVSATVTMDDDSGRANLTLVDGAVTDVRLG